MKYVYDQPVSSKTRVAKTASNEKRGAVSSSNLKDSSSGKKKRRSHGRAKDVDSDEDKVYVMRPESKVEATPRRPSDRESEESVVEKSTPGRPPSRKANATRKPPQRRHTAPVRVAEVEEERSR